MTPTGGGSARVRALLFALCLAAAATACTDLRPDQLVERTLDARERTTAEGDVKGYAALFHPDYRFREDVTDTIESMTRKRFTQYRSIRLVTSNRRISFEQEGEIARVVQEFTLFAETMDGRHVRHSDVEHFLLKRHRDWLFRVKYLFYEGLGF